ncbi:MAG: sensor histidine kinase [Deltaproteobacteria bacterium]|jgi:sensor histidine kinase regulating citrate/malate metabolism|nr:sensor histidine kinase [Deltaproteobacteria bacterium]
MLFLDIFVATAMLVLSVGLAARYSMNMLERGLIDNLSNVAQLLAASQEVSDGLEQNRLTPQLEEFLDRTIKNQKSIDVITIAGLDSIRLYHPDKSRIGQKFAGGDEGRVLKGEHYHSRAAGTLGDQSRYLCPVFDHQGKQIGFVLVSMLMDNFETLKSGVIGVHLKSFGLVFALTTAFLAFIALSIKRSLLGYEPAQITKIFLQRQEVIDSLEEGLLAVDEKGVVILANKAAERILDLGEMPVLGEDVDSLLPELNLKEALDGSKDYNISLVTDSISAIYNKLPINSRGRLMGALAIIRDRSEVTRLAEQITGFNHLLNALRANTHEFKNQLHVILGLLHSGAYEEAKKYITLNGQVHSEALTTIAKNIENRALGALILGKINQCHELGIRMNILSDSRIPRHSLFLPTKGLITIVGNLVENAADAIKAAGGHDPRRTTELGEDDAHEISLFIYEDDKSLLISVDDSGIGCTADEIRQMENPGYTTKGPGRGMGLSLIRAVVSAHHGQFSIDSDKGVGTSMELVFRVPRGRTGVFP